MKTWKNTEQQLLALGMYPIYGGGSEKKGNGFWIYTAPIADQRSKSITNDGAASGNRYFWMMRDARNLLAMINEVIA